MQLIIVSLALFFLVLTQDLKAQVRKIAPDRQSDLSKGDTTEMNLPTYIQADWQTIDVDFLSSYYAQDGNNAAVTGGIGTEQLTDFTQKVIVSLPINPKFKLNLDGGYDYYSSASTDNIDNVRSSDSSSDIRVHGNIGVNYQRSETHSIGLRFGGSVEYDYTSINGGFSTNFLSPDKNTAVQFGVQAFIDRWSLIYPQELRRSARAPTNQRRSYNAALGISRVLNKKMQIHLQLEGVYMQGLLSTPFHRVYFQEQQQAKIEKLPASRLKIPIGLRLNSHISERLIARFYYRYYWDDWGVQAHTTSLELPVKLNRFLSVYPFYRYHRQSAADYFKPYKEHSLQDEFYTSDFDLSALESHSYGMGISWSPVNGLAKVPLPFKKRSVLMVESVDLKYSHFDRSTGLKADIISLALRFSF